MDSGTVGGFYADSEYGYVMESRKEPVLIRETGMMGETDFLYSANSALHPDANQAGWMKDPSKWDWHPHGGWRPKNFSFFNKIGLIYFGSSARICTLCVWAKLQEASHQPARSLPVLIHPMAKPILIGSLSWGLTRKMWLPGHG